MWLEDRTAGEAGFHERRADPRRRVLLTGKLAFANTAVTADCAIRNLSEHGAMIALPDLPLPKDPFLIVIKEAFLHEAQTIWRAEGRSGLRFVTSWRLTRGSPEAVTPLRNLWLELLPH